MLQVGSGLTDDIDFRKAVLLKVTKINIGTASFKNVTGLRLLPCKRRGKHD